MLSWKLKGICLHLNLIAWDQEYELGLGRGTATKTDNDSKIIIRWCNVLEPLGQSPSHLFPLKVQLEVF